MGCTANLEGVKVGPRRPRINSQSAAFGYPHYPHYPSPHHKYSPNQNYVPWQVGLYTFSLLGSHKSQTSHRNRGAPIAFYWHPLSPNVVVHAPSSGPANQVSPVFLPLRLLPRPPDAKIYHFTGFLLNPDVSVQWTSVMDREIDVQRSNSVPHGDCDKALHDFIMLI